MKQRKKLLSFILVVSLMLSLISSSMVVSAIDTDIASSKENTYGLRDNCQDGVILHCWNCSYNNIKSKLKDIANAGFTTIQTSPVQQPKDYNSGYRDVGGQWWKLYQPLSFSIAPGGSWLGSKSELTSLCTEAHKYGIKVICDIVANHTSNGGDGGSVDWNLSRYESQLYNDQGRYFHSYCSCDDGSIEHVVRGNIGEPDLNTGDSYVQQRVGSLLTECVNCGVDGFRFDAAKHIETPDDGDYRSNFWPNVLSTADKAAKAKSKTLYYYGEILNTCGNGRSVSSYTKYMSVTDNVTGNERTSSVSRGDSGNVANTNLRLGAPRDKTVLWAESHDTWADGSSQKYNQSDLDKSYCFSTALKETTTLYFLRPVGDMGSFNQNSFKSSQVTGANKFHNHFVGADESTRSDGSLAICERYSGDDTGVLIVNCNGTSKNLSGVSVSHMKNGTYKDIVSGKSVTVSGGKITSGEIGSSGVAVIFNDVPINTPTNTISTPGGTFKTDTLTLTLGLLNATSGTYQIDNGTKTTYTKTTSITIGKNMDFDTSTTIYLTATDGKKTTEVKYTFTKIDPTATPFKFDNDRAVYLLDTCQWKTQHCCYAWTGDGEKKNASWPGVDIEKVGEYEGYNVYKYIMPEGLDKLIFNEGSRNKTGDLNFEKYSYYDNEKEKWVYVGKQEPTTPTQPVTVPTQPVTKVTEPTYETDLFLGDANLDKNIDVVDASTIQKHVAKMVTLSSDSILCSDVDESGKIEVVDATLIQKYVAKMSTGYNIGKKIKSAETKATVPTTPTTPTQETKVDTDNITVYVNMGKKIDTYAYYWLKDHEGPISYPGIKMTRVSGYVYKVTFNKTYNMIIFSATNMKTPDLEVKGDGYIYDYQKGTWSKYAVDPSSPTEPAEETLDFSNSRKLYIINDGNWSKINMHTWGSYNTEWPGEKVQKSGTYKGYDLYIYTFKDNFDGYVINNGQEQTGDIFENISYTQHKVFSTKEKNFIDI